MSETRETGNPPPANIPTGNSPPADDLRSLIAGFTAEAKKPAAAEAASGQDTASSGAAAESSAGSRDEEPADRSTGAAAAPEPPPKTAGEAAAPAAGAAQPEGGPPAGGGETPAPPPAAAGDTSEQGEGKPAALATAPEHWSAGDRAVFNNLPDQAKEPFLSMYKRMEGGFQQKLQRGAALDKDYGPLDQIFTPETRAYMQTQRGLAAPHQIIQYWAATEKALLTPGSRDQVLAQLIHAYGADPGMIARWINQLRGFPADPATQSYEQPGPAVGPAVGNGQDPATGMHPAIAQRFQAIEDREDSRRLAEANHDIEAFANEKDGEGNLAHPFFAELEPEMTRLAQADRLAGRVPVIKDLYDRAVWANPETRDKLQASQRDAEERREAAARKAKTEAAARAGSSITGAPSSGQVPSSSSPDRTIRDEIRAQMRGNGRI